MFGADNIAKLMEKDWNDFVVEVDIDDQKKKLHKNCNRLLSLPEQMKIGKVEKVVPNLSNKRKYVLYS